MLLNASIAILLMDTKLEFLKSSPARSLENLIIFI